MIRVDCSQFAEFKVELAGYISERLEGSAIALVQTEDIIIDWISDPQQESSAQVISIMRSFLDAKNLSRQFTLDSYQDFISILRGAGTPVSKNPKKPNLPPNLLQCAHCGYVTSNEMAYRFHERLHYLRF